MLPALSTRRFQIPTLTMTPQIHREIDGLFDRFFGEFANNGHSLPVRNGMVPVAVWEDAQAVHVEVELPGMSHEDVEVVVHQGQLRIWGERQPHTDNRTYWCNERLYGKFERSITLPETIDPETIEAQMRDGILSVQFQKQALV